MRATRRKGNQAARGALLCGLLAFAGCLPKQDQPCGDGSASNCCLSDDDCATLSRSCNLKAHTCFPSTDAGAGETGAAGRPDGETGGQGGSGGNAGNVGQGGNGGSGGSGFACTNSTDCHAASLLACDLNTHACVACIESSDCPRGACNTATHACVECVVSSDCKTPSKKACDTASHTCVGCVGNGDCVAPTAVCNTTAKTCVGCLASTDCSDPKKPVCDGSKKACVGCMAKSDCTTQTAGPLCDVSSQSCVGCLADTDCGGTTPICEKTTKACVACANDAACVAKGASAPGCASSGACVACKNLADSKALCASTAAPICDSGTNACRGCKTDAECGTAYGANPGVCVGGQCLVDTQVIYTKAAATVPECTAADGSSGKPFCDLLKASTLLSSTRNVLLVRGPDAVSGAALTFAAVPVLIVGQAGGTITSTSLGGSISFSAGDVTLRDLTISRNTAGPGVSATGGTLRMTRCQVLNNKSGVETTNAAFDLTNTVVAGSTGSAAGVSLGATPAKPTTFAFNTVTGNAGTGVFCTTGTNYSVANSIVGSNGPAQTFGCVFTDPCATTCSPTPSLDSKYHLTAASTLCIDKATGTAPAPADDLDGDPRPQGAAAECGADERKTP